MPLVEAALSAARLTRLAALGTLALLAGRRIHRPAVAPTIAVVAIITDVAAVAARAIHCWTSTNRLAPSDTSGACRQ